MLKKYNVTYTRYRRISKGQNDGSEDKYSKGLSYTIEMELPPGVADDQRRSLAKAKIDKTLPGNNFCIVTDVQSQ